MTETKPTGLLAQSIGAGGGFVVSTSDPITCQNIQTDSNH